MEQQQPFVWLFCLSSFPEKTEREAGRERDREREREREE